MENKNNDVSRLGEAGFLSARYKTAAKTLCILFICVILMVINFTACQSDSNNGQTSASDDSNKVSSGVSWQAQEYSDDYLSYEIPVAWARSEEYSNSERNFAFFQVIHEIEIILDRHVKIEWRYLGEITYIFLCVNGVVKNINSVYQRLSRR